MRRKPSKRLTQDKRDRSQRIRAAWLARYQPAVTVLAFAANRIASLGLARDEMERKA